MHLERKASQGFGMWFFFLPQLLENFELRLQQLTTRISLSDNCAKSSPSANFKPDKLAQTWSIICAKTFSSARLQVYFLFGRIFKDRIADYTALTWKLPLWHRFHTIGIQQYSWQQKFALRPTYCDRLQEATNQTTMRPKLKLLTGLQCLLSLQPFYNLIRCVS